MVSSAFSCFSPSYAETIKSHHPAAFSHSALAHLNANYPVPVSDLGHLPPRAEGRSQGELPSRSAGRVLKRRSQGPVSKDMIGLPTNFVHAGHIGRPLDGAAARELEETLASLSAALSSNLPASSSHSPSYSPPDALPTKSLPPSPSDRPSPPFDRPSPSDSRPEPPAKEPTPTKAQGKRKPAPAVTASVIRQAGERAVYASGAGKDGRGAEEWAELEVGNDWAELGRGDGSGKEMKEEVAGMGEEEKTVEELLREEEGVDGMRRRKGDAGMTDTTRVKWDGAMREIELALKM